MSVLDHSTGHVDLQINGYAGVDFNADALDDAALDRALGQLADDGVAAVLPTIITAPIGAMCRRIRTIAARIDRGGTAGTRLAGIHVEGPFLNAADGFVGAHPADAVRPATIDDAKHLIDAGGGHVRLLTLAPEQDPGGTVTRFLTDQGIVVAAGHSDASRDQLRQSIDAGLRLFTHLGNGAPALLPRHDNIIQRVLSLADRLAISLIADGHHLPPYVLKNFLNWIPDENVIIVTDAIAAAGLGPGEYRFAGAPVFVDDDGACRSADRRHFAGSAATMPQMIAVLGDQLKVDPAAIRRWTGDNPRRLLGEI